MLRLGEKEMFFKTEAVIALASFSYVFLRSLRRPNYRVSIFNGISFKEGFASKPEYIPENIKINFLNFVR